MGYQSSLVPIMPDLQHALSIAIIHAAPTAYYFAGSQWLLPILILNSFMPITAGLITVWLSPEALAVTAGINVATMLAISIWMPMLFLTALKLSRTVNRA